MSCLVVIVGVDAFFFFFAMIDIIGVETDQGWFSQGKIGSFGEFVGC